MLRQYDPKPVPSEEVQEYIDRVICGEPASRLWFWWYWKPPGLEVFSQRYTIQDPPDPHGL